jgi:hypothetical protein
MKAVIVGDSQSQGAGPYLRDRLRNDFGYTVPAPYGKHGAGSVGVLGMAKLAAADHPDAELVIVFSGSVEKNAIAGQGVIDLWPNAQIVWYGSAPATTITDVAYAKKVFGSKVTSSDYWFTSGEAEAREKRNVQLPTLLPARIQYVDWRTLSLPNAVVQPSGVKFPNLKDGIHILGETAKAAFAGDNWPPVPDATDKKTSAMPLLFAGLIAGLLWFRGRK